MGRQNQHGPVPEIHPYKGLYRINSILFAGIAALDGADIIMELVKAHPNPGKAIVECIIGVGATLGAAFNDKKHSEQLQIASAIQEPSDLPNE